MLVGPLETAVRALVLKRHWFHSIYLTLNYIHSTFIATLLEIFGVKVLIFKLCVQ